MFLGHKNYNLNGFLITQNLRDMKKGKKFIMNPTMKTSILRKKPKKHNDKDTIITQA